MAEEQKWQEAAGGHRLCANNCGFFGSPTTLNLCSKCYKDHYLKEQQLSDASKFVVEKSLAPPPSSDSLPSFSFDAVPVADNPVDVRFFSSDAPAAATAAAEVTDVVATRPNRCATCRRRMGLTAFKCRCGTTFCGTHRYPEQHGCDFDFKAMGREEIARANPVIKAEKLQKI